MLEIYAATRKQAGCQNNRDAYFVSHRPLPIVAVADGVGNANSTARTATKLLEQILRNTEPAVLRFFKTWEGIAKSLDSYLCGGPQTTLVAAVIIGEGVYGVQVGDSRCYRVAYGDQYLNSVGIDTKPYLGSGECQCSPIHLRLLPDEYLIFASDGAWNTFDRLSLQKAWREAQHFSDIPTLLLQQALRQNGGLAADDMTIAVVRR